MRAGTASGASKCKRGILVLLSHELELIRTVFFFVFVALLFPSQRFWFRRALRWVDRYCSPVWRRIARGCLFAFLGVVIASLINHLAFHFVPRSVLGGWIDGAVQIWLFTAFFAFLALKAVHGLERVWSGVSQRQEPKRQSDSPAQHEYEMDAHLRARPSPNPGERVGHPAGDVAVHPANGAGPTLHHRRAFFKYLAYAAGSAPFIAGVYGFSEERTAFTVRRVEMAIPGLDNSLDGLRIAQLSDIHIGEFMPRDEIRRAVDMANALRPDLSVVTGDFITDSYDPLEDCIAELSRLRSPLGVWGCNGNHEHYADAEEESQILFSRYGMRLLRHQAVPVSWRGGNLNLIGVDYQRERLKSGELAPMLVGVDELVRRDMPNILLSHNPNSFPRAAEMGIQLSLAGHTHGGQIKVEIVDHSISPARFMTRYIAGLYGRQGDGGRSYLYVNRGLGTIAVPARIGVPPEITLITLRSRNG
jgi:uncharacterized protein